LPGKPHLLVLKLSPKEFPGKITSKRKLLL
jgi:hypothetical protein